MDSSESMISLVFIIYLESDHMSLHLLLPLWSYLLSSLTWFVFLLPLLPHKGLHLMQRVDSLEKTLMLGMIGGRRRRG